jgi:hypothetical protein
VRRIAAVLIVCACAAGCRQIFGIEPVSADARGDGGRDGIGDDGSDGRGSDGSGSGDGSNAAGPLIATPSVDVVLVSGSVLVGSSVQVRNPSSQPYTIASFTRDSTCASSDPSATASVDSSPITLPPFSGAFVQAACTGNAGSFDGMQRCLYHGLDAGNADVVDFMIVCEYAMTGVFSAAPTQVDFSDIPTGGSSPTSIVTITNNAASPATGIAIQIDDLAGNFKVSMPCTASAISCDKGTIVVGTGSPLSVVVQCTPQTRGMHSAQLYLASKDLKFLGSATQTTVTLTCNGT